MFAALVGRADAPVAIGDLESSLHVVELRSRQPKVVFACSTASGDPEATGIVCLEGRYWLVGRIRLDGRETLRRRLAQSSGLDHRDASDALLCLAAYALWGERFIDELAGDFCFTLWDDERRRLIAARDRLGVRPLFHADIDNSRIVSDSLAWLAQRLPSRPLDDRWVADFLCIGYCFDAERTAFQNVNRLAPAHLLVIDEVGQKVRRYWRLVVDQPMYLRRSRDYSERFLELMALSIADRLGDGRVGVSMSGGLDSTTLAACAVQATRDPSRVVAECTHFETAMHDEEKHFSTLVARHLGIELVLRAADELAYDPAWRTRSFRFAEPSLSVVCAERDRQIACEQAARAPVWFFGEGPDNSLVYERDAYLAWLLRRRDWGRLAEAALLSLVAKGADGWTATLARLAGRRAPAVDTRLVPPWIAPDLAADLHLEERLRDGPVPGAGRHPWHPRAVASFNDPIWASLLEEFEFDPTIQPITWRHPYLDLRVLEFLLAVPPVPWARRKLLMRKTMDGRLPAAVLARRKAPLAQAPLVEPLRRYGLPDLARPPQFARYVEVRSLPAPAAWSPGDLRRLIAVHALDHWLASTS